MASPGHTQYRELLIAGLAADHFDEWRSQLEEELRLPASESLEHTEELIALLTVYAGLLRGGKEGANSGSILSE